MRILTTYTRADFDRFYSGGWWSDRTIPATLARHAAERPDRLALVHGQRRRTYGELHAEVERAAAGLAAAGVRREDVLSIQLPNSIELAALVLACARLGAIYNPLNPGYRRAEVEAITGLVEPAAVVCPASHRGFAYPPLIEQATAGLDPAPLRVVVGGDAPRGWTTYAGLLAAGEATLDPAFDPGEADPDAVFLLGATSGTTGHPKVYVHVANTQLQEAHQLNSILGFGPDDVFLAMAPMTHRGALMYGFLTAMEAGAAVVLVEAYAPDLVLDLFARERISAFMAIPTQAIDLLDLQEREPRDTGSLRRAMLSGAPVPAQVIRRFGELFPTCVPVSGYGMSECGYATMTRPGDPPDKLTTSGRPAMGMEIEIRGEDGAPLPAGEVGSIHIRGPYVCGGYFDDQRATRAALDRDGWLASGDLGFLDDDGYVHPVGRLKHVIIRGGLKIHAEEVEFLLIQHPSVAAACVVGVPDERLGERACACVVLGDGATFTIADLRTFLEGRGVAKHVWPERVLTLDAFPLTPVGKVDRRGIRERALAAASPGST